MDASASPPIRRPVGLVVALISAPAAVTLQLSISYALVKWACATDRAWVLGLLAGIAFACTLAGVALGAWNLETATRWDAGGDWYWSGRSRRLLACVAIGLGLFSAIFVVNSAIAIAHLSPCE
jgi:hypothetical protein